jgi:hypothetical protein
MQIEGILMRNCVWLCAVALVLLGGRQLLAQNQPSTAPTSAPATQACASEPTPAKAEDWVYKSKHPCSWLSWGFDERLRDEYGKNVKTLRSDQPKSEFNFGRFRSRLWSTVTPVQDLDINSRLVWEFRTYSEPTGLRDVDMNEAIFDNLNVTWKNIGGNKNNKIIVGRQDIVLADGWLVLDGTPLDGSRTIFFDAVRGIFEHQPSKTTFDMSYIDQSGVEDRWIDPFNHREFVTAESGGKIITKQNLLMEQDERGAILWVTNKAIKDTEIDPFFIYKHDEPIVPGVLEEDVFTPGLRLVHDFDKNWTGSAQVAEQFGQRGDQGICALGFKSMLEYFFRDANNNRLRTAFEYLSGDDPDSKSTYEGFNILWGRWPQWSEIYSNVIALDQVRPAAYSNLSRIQFGHTIAPCKQWEFLTDYHLLFANQPVVGREKVGINDGGGYFRGQIVTWLAKYKFTDNISGHFLTEFFAPGNFYRDFRNDVVLYMRYELVFTW